jgi:hypothetical protein
VRGRGNAYCSTKVVPGPKDSKELDAAIEILVDARWISPNASREGERSGRSRKDFVVNPRVYEAHA